MSLKRSRRQGRAAASLGRAVCPVRRVDSDPVSRAAVLGPAEYLAAPALAARLGGLAGPLVSKVASVADLGPVGLRARADCLVSKAVRPGLVDCPAAAVPVALVARLGDPVAFPVSRAARPVADLDPVDLRGQADCLVSKAAVPGPVDYPAAAALVALAARLVDPVVCPVSRAAAPDLEGLKAQADCLVSRAAAPGPADYPAAAVLVALVARLVDRVVCLASKAARLDLADCRAAAVPAVGCLVSKVARHGPVDCLAAALVVLAARLGGPVVCPASSKVVPAAGLDRAACPARVLLPAPVAYPAGSQVDLALADCRAAVVLAARLVDPVVCPANKVALAVRPVADRAPARCLAQSAALRHVARAPVLWEHPLRQAQSAGGPARLHRGPAQAPARPRGGAVLPHVAGPKPRKPSRSCRSIPSSISWGSCAFLLRWSRSSVTSRDRPAC